MRAAPLRAVPVAQPGSNIADLRAQIAANEKGVQELRAMVEHFGLDVVRAYMGHVQDNAEEAVRRVISALQDGAVPLRARQRRGDQGGDPGGPGERGPRRSTSPAPRRSCPNNFNAPSSVAMAAVLYVFRTLVDDEIPLNSGCLKPLQVIIPPGSMLSPGYPAAVVAGNVETSQAITGALYAALGVHGRGLGDHEQPHASATTGTSTTRRSPAAPAPGTGSPAPTSCRPT